MPVTTVKGTARVVVVVVAAAHAVAMVTWCVLCCYARYDDEADGVTSYQRIDLRNLEKIEIGN